MRNRLFAVICVLLALAMLPGGASAKAKKAPKKDIGIQLYSVRSLIGVFGKSQGDYKPVLKQLADMIQQHHRHGFGIFAHGHRAKGGDGHEEVFVEDLPVYNALASFLEHIQPYDQVGQQQ